MSQRGPLPFERLGLIDDPVPRGAALNMALDEILLGGLASEPLLRIYRWERPAVSIGCFDQASPVLRDWPRHEIVRRWTGGGIVEHGRDVTFSLLVPRTLPLAGLPASESYRFIHAAVATALKRIGNPEVTLQAASVQGGIASSRACFANPVTHDLLVAGRKVAGGAQRRTRHGLLHQGSIQNEDAYWPAVGRQPWRVALVEALPEAFGSCVGQRRPSEAEIAAAESLAAVKYGGSAWLRRF